MAFCPKCRGNGLEVEKIVVANHAKEMTWPLGEEQYFLCETPGCDVVYFTESHSRILKTKEVKTRVAFKCDSEPKPLCYCKQVTEEDVLRVIAEGANTFEEVKEATGIGGGGFCKITNPAGRCCSRNYKPFIMRALEERAEQESR
jgi:bacterioferritin-associated ferredoxin